MLKSKCCAADVYVCDGHRRYGDGDTITTRGGDTLWYECAKCKQACDIVEEFSVLRVNLDGSEKPYSAMLSVDVALRPKER